MNVTKSWNFTPYGKIKKLQATDCETPWLLDCTLKAIVIN